MSFESRLDELFRLNGKDFIVESSLSRVWQHVTKPKSTFGVISPFRKENSKKENEDNYIELKKIVRDMGYGYIEMKGGYKEEEGFVNERSLLIPNIKRKEIVDLGKQYDQWSVLFKDEKQFVELGSKPASGIDKVLQTFVKGDDNMTFAKDAIKDFFSSLFKGSHKGKKFLFKLQELEENSFNKSAYHKDDLRWITIWEDGNG